MEELDKPMNRDRTTFRVIELIKLLNLYCTNISADINEWESGSSGHVSRCNGTETIQRYDPFNFSHLEWIGDVLQKILDKYVL